MFRRPQLGVQTTAARCPDDRSLASRRPQLGVQTTAARRPDDRSSASRRPQLDVQTTAARRPDDRSSVSRRPQVGVQTTTARRPDDRSSMSRRRQLGVQTTAARRPDDRSSASRRPQLSVAPPGRVGRPGAGLPGYSELSGRSRRRAVHPLVAARSPLERRRYHSPHLDRCRRRPEPRAARPRLGQAPPPASLPIDRSALVALVLATRRSDTHAICAAGAVLEVQPGTIEVRQVHVWPGIRQKRLVPSPHLFNPIHKVKHDAQHQAS